MERKNIIPLIMEKISIFLFKFNGFDVIGKKKFKFNGKPENIFIVFSKKIRYNAMAILTAMGITKDCLKNFKNIEIKSLLFHEIYHTKPFSIILKTLSFLFLLFMFIFISLLIRSIFINEIFSSFFIMIDFIFSTFIFILLNWITEIKADLYASKKVGKNIFRRTIKKLFRLARKERNFITKFIIHPPDEIRLWFIDKFG